MADPLLEYVRKLSAETGREMPTPNPDGPLSEGRVLFVLRDPGATQESGANKTGITDPYVNEDPTAVRFRRALGEANIDRTICVWWNAMPYHLGYKGQLRPSDISAGARYLRGFTECLADLRVMVAMGEGAHDVARRLSSGEGKKLPPVIYAPHPMIYGRGAKERMSELRQRLEDVAQLLAAPAR